MSLGRGLESLIPPQDNNPSQNANSSVPDSSPENNIEQPKLESGLSEVLAFHELKTIPQKDISLEVKPESREDSEIARRGDSIFHIEVEKIKPNPHQPRRHFDEAALRDLASSIREFGVIQPLVVSKLETETPLGTAVEYQLIAGERRLMASKLAGLPRVPVIVRNVPLEREKLELAIIENLQREDLNPIENARAFSRLQDEFGLTQREIAVRLGKSRESVANTMRLLNLPSFVQDAIAKKQISESQGRLLLAVSDISAQQKLFEDLLKESMSVRELKSRIKKESRGEDAAQLVHAPVDPELKFVKDQLESFLGTPVSIHRSGESGKIVIDFYSEEELRGILQKINPEEA